MFDPENPDNEKSVKVKLLREDFERLSVRKAAARADLAIAEKLASKAKEALAEADNAESIALRRLTSALD
jgi:hypothetical protein